MLFIGDLDNRGLSKKLAKRLGVDIIYPDKHIFPDGEMRVRILEDVADQEILLLKSHVAPVDSNVLETCFIADALKRNGAGLITAVIPYVGYMRADHMFRPGEGVPLEVVISMLEHAGIAKVVIFDPHSIRIPELFHIPVVNLSALEAFAEAIKKLELPKNSYTLVAPDKGGMRRAKILSELLGDVPYVSIKKNRDLETGNVEAAKVEGEIRETCFIIDDMISSGGTIVKAIDALEREGAKNIYVMATHGVFSENAPRLLQGSNAIKVYVTDSIPAHESKKFQKLEILTISDLLVKNLV